MNNYKRLMNRDTFYILLTLVYVLKRHNLIKITLRKHIKKEMNIKN